MFNFGGYVLALAKESYYVLDEKLNLLEQRLYAGDGIAGDMLNASLSFDGSYLVMAMTASICFVYLERTVDEGIG